MIYIVKNEKLLQPTVHVFGRWVHANISSYSQGALLQQQKKVKQKYKLRKRLK